jgi:hypothetical protein
MEAGDERVFLDDADPFPPSHGLNTSRGHEAEHAVRFTPGGARSRPRETSSYETWHMGMRGNEFRAGIQTFDTNLLTQHLAVFRFLPSFPAA